MDTCPYLRVGQVASLTGLSEREVWRKASSDPTFPKPFKLSPRRTAWKRAAVEAWTESQLQKAGS